MSSTDRSKSNTVSLLIPNMHCPSCLTHINSLLAPFPLEDVAISLLSRTVTFVLPHRHGEEKNVFREVVETLKDDGGFQVSNVGGAEGGLPSYTKITTAKEPAGRKGFYSRFFGGGMKSQEEVVPMSERRRRHVENCQACQIEEAAAAGGHTGQQGGSGDQQFGEEEEQAKEENEEKERGVEVWESTFSIKGMTCSACTSSISHALSLHASILKSEINLLSSSAQVTYTHPAITDIEIREIIDDTGFDVEILSSRRVAQPKEDVTQSWAAKTTLSISGMTCSACSGSITTNLLALPGVKEVSISAVTHSGVVFHDTAVIGIEEIKEAVEDSGYECTVIQSVSDGERGKAEKGKGREESVRRTVVVRVDGVFCKECIAKLNSHLTSLSSSNQITSFTPFTLLTTTTTSSGTKTKKKLNYTQSTITYAPQEPLTIRSLLSSLKDVDEDQFEASLVKVKSVTDCAEEIQREERNVLIKHFAVAFAVAVPTFIIAIVGMVLLPSTSSFRQYFTTSVWGNASRGTVSLWCLATVVQFGVGKLFYSRAWKSIWPHLRFLLPFSSSKNQKLKRLNWRSAFSFGSMDLLVVLSTSTSYFASLAMMILSVKEGKGSSMEEEMTYFDSCVFLIGFILAGRVLEAFAKSKTTSAIGLLGSLRPETAFLMPDPNLQPILPSISLDLEKDDIASQSSFSEDIVVTNEPTSTPVDHLEIGDYVLVRPGDFPPVDGTIVSGSTQFDESSLTGESLPAKKNPGDQVLTGTTNLSSAVVIRVDAVGQETMVEKIIRAVSEASNRKAPIERLAEKITGVFVPVIVYIALGVLVVWLGVSLGGVIPDSYLGMDQMNTSGRVFFAFQFAIAALVISCPCGIGLAAPCAQAVGMGMAAESGILASGGGSAFQAATQVNHICLDKTGTITTGNMTVTDHHMSLDASDGLSEEQVWKILKVVEGQSSHPLAQAITSFSDSLTGSLSENYHLATSEELAGKGMTATMSNSTDERIYQLWIGNERLLLEAGLGNLPLNILPTVKRWRSEAKSVVFIGLQIPNNALKVIAVIAVADPPRQEAKDIVKSLQSRGQTVWMVTGDVNDTAEAVAAQVGIPKNNVRSGLMPEGKGEVIKELQNEVHRDGRFWGIGGRERASTVLFVGDGLNDSIPIAQADIGVAMSHGSEVTIALADFVLLNSSLKGLSQLLNISRKVYNRQKLNFAWALLFNMVCIPLAAGAFFPLGHTRLSPVWSALAMALSSTSVVCSSLALRWGL